MWNRTSVMRRVAIAGAAVIVQALAPDVLAADPERPYQGSCSTVVTPLTAPGVFPQELRIDLDCTLAHLGRATGVSMQTVVPISVTGPVVTTLIENTTTYQAANGDVLDQSFTGTALINLETGDVLHRYRDVRRRDRSIRSSFRDVRSVGNGIDHHEHRLLYGQGSPRLLTHRRFGPRGFAGPDSPRSRDETVEIGAADCW